MFFVSKCDLSAHDAIGVQNVLLVRKCAIGQLMCSYEDNTLLAH